MDFLSHAVRQFVSRLPYRRQLTFGAVGISVMAVSYLSLVFQISVLGMNPLLAYAIQAVLAIELNFALNQMITWRDRPVTGVSELLVRLGKFNLTRWALAFPINWLLFAGLTAVGINYLIANTICIGMATILNYVVGDRFIFVPGKDAVAPLSLAPLGLRNSALQSVSIVIPVKRSHRTIRKTVDSLLAQDYLGSLEIILVGDYQDSTWVPLRDLITSNRITVIETEILCPGRDANAKRNVGFEYATGEIVALTDSDMVLPPDWVSTGVSLINDGWDCVAGSMQSMDPGFWGRYVDRNQLGSKTPRMEKEYVLTRETYGQDGRKPPVTANVFAVRELVDGVGEMDPHFVFTWEDYEWFRHIVDCGYRILCTDRLVAGHYHRQGFRDLIKEYTQSGQGTGDYVYKYPHCRFGRLRVKQLAATYFLAAAVVVALPASVLFPPLAAAVLGSGALLGVVSAVRAKSVVGVFYPAITFVLGMAYAIALTRRLLQGKNLSEKTLVVSSDVLDTRIKLPA